MPGKVTLEMSRAVNFRYGVHVGSCTLYLFFYFFMWKPLHCFRKAVGKSVLDTQSPKSLYVLSSVRLLVRGTVWLSSLFRWRRAWTRESFSSFYNCNTLEWGFAMTRYVSRKGRSVLRKSIPPNNIGNHDIFEFMSSISSQRMSTRNCAKRIYSIVDREVTFNSSGGILIWKTGSACY